MIDNLRRGVICRGSVDALSQNFFGLEEHGLYELASVGLGIEEWDRHIGRRGQSKRPVAVTHVTQALSGEVGHVETGVEEGCRDAEGTDILLNPGLTIEMVDVWKYTIGD